MDIRDASVILASGSPRRLDMLRSDGIEPRVLRPDCDEAALTAMTPEQEVMALAVRKNLRVLEMLREAKEPGGIVLSADTMVVLDGAVLGKPSDEADAVRMLRALRARAHTVCSGVCISDTESGRILAFFEKTGVLFGDYTDEEIAEYVAAGEPMDKAGAYAVQGGFAKHVERIDGSLDNVIGLPYGKIKAVLADW